MALLSKQQSLQNDFEWQVIQKISKIPNAWAALDKVQTNKLQGTQDSVHMTAEPTIRHMHQDHYSMFTSDGNNMCHCIATQWHK